MPKLKAPLLSLQAFGQFTKNLVIRRRQKLAILEKKPIPKDAKTALQLSWRHMYQKAIALWNALSQDEKKEWESLARPKHMTGLAYFISQALKPNPGLYLPLQGGTMSGEIDMAKNLIKNLPTPVADQDAANKEYVDAITPGADFPMKLKPALTRWVIPGWLTADYVTNITSTAGRIYYIPIFVSETTTYIRIGVYVHVASAGTADLRIFNWSNGLPSSLVLSTGTVNTGTTGAKEIVISQQLTRGYYFLAYRCTGTPNLRAPSFYALLTPVPAINTALDGFLRLIIPIVDAAYADPAPTPTDILDQFYAAVYLREN